MSIDVRSDLAALAADAFASKHLLEAIPRVFDADLDSYVAWKTELGRKLSVDPRAIALIGSACLGVSLNPTKSLKPFDENSDVDVAIVSHYHFETAWRSLRSLGPAQRLRLSRHEHQMLRDHKSRLIYWGTVATDRVLTLLPFGKQWTIALNDMALVDPTTGREIKARIYRDFEALRAYQMISIQRAQKTLIDN